MKVTLLCACENYNEYIIKNYLKFDGDRCRAGAGYEAGYESGYGAGYGSGDRVRGETEYGCGDRQLICNPYLSSKGLNDAQHLSHSKVFDLVICSPLNASKKTFALSNIQHSGFHRIFISFLCRETMIDMGDFFEHEFIYKKSETQTDINNRIYAFVDYLNLCLDKYGLRRDHANILIVTHRNFIYNFTTLFSKSYHCNPGEFIICDV